MSFTLILYDPHVWISTNRRVYVEKKVSQSVLLVFLFYQISSIKVSEWVWEREPKSRHESSIIVKALLLNHNYRNGWDVTFARVEKQVMLSVV